ncbi:uncharacterized protein LOC115755840 [Rhodamnia argentea]|uniref:Uncharacterized protein LOC115755840 n=1 Tax=Rhodamnia argentea TaxID=178133 RepID=A0A8B8QW18_9MYRT|nr:uncharacterized protein LOC115755840 [Rhodamnia argentea]
MINKGPEVFANCNKGELYAVEYAIKVAAGDEKTKKKSKDDKIKERVLEKLRATEVVSVSPEAVERVCALEPLHRLKQLLVDIFPILSPAAASCMVDDAANEVEALSSSSSPSSKL